MDIGSIILQNRQEKGLSQKQLAELIGVSTGTVAEWESGESFPNLEQLQYICTIFKIDINQVSYQPFKNEAVSYTQIPVPLNEQYKKKRNYKRLVIGIVGIVFVLSIVAGAFWFLAHNKKNEDKMLPFSDDPEAIEYAEKSVVKLNCYNGKDVLISSGSGVSLFDSGIIVTNYHVVEKVAKVEIITDNEEHYNTDQVVAYDKDRDIVILKCPDNLKLMPLTTGDDNLIKKGEKVVTISSPIGITNSVSTGVFSGTIIDEYMRVLQFTAPISHGSSGGALFNDKGEVIGITFGAYESGQNLNLAVPVSDIERIYMGKTDETFLLSEMYELTPYEALLELLSDKTQIEMEFAEFRDQFVFLSPRNVYFVYAYNSSSFRQVDSYFKGQVILTFSDLDSIGKESKKNRNSNYFWGHVTNIYEDGFLEFKTNESHAKNIKSCDRCIIICAPSSYHDHIVIYGILNLETGLLI